MNTYNVIEYGAKPDSNEVCTKAIQRAIDICPEGGTVYVPKGLFLTGALYLKSGITFFLDEGARLQGSGRIEDFPLMGYPYEGLDQLCYASLLNTDGAPHKNITIDGKGVIDAAGVALFKSETDENRGKRGRAVLIRNTENLVIKNVTIRQSPAWCLHIIYCKNVFIDNVEIHSKYDEYGKAYGMYNCDGMDIDSCVNVKITNSLIASQDDCIAIKSGRDSEGRRVGIPSENIEIENCAFKSGFGVAIGSEMSGGVRDVYVRNCTFEDVFSIASIKATRGRGGYIKNIHYENCSLINRDTSIKATRWFKGAIYADGFYGIDETDLDSPAEVNDGTPTVDGIYLKNITADTIEGYAIYLCGLPEAPYKNIYLENVKANGKYGMFTKNTDNLQLINVDVSSCDD